MTSTFSFQLVTGTIYKTEPTVALGQTDLVSIADITSSRLEEAK